jgi:hypothetical protein
MEGGTTLLGGQNSWRKGKGRRVINEGKGSGVN